MLGSKFESLSECNQFNLLNGLAPCCESFVNLTQLLIGKLSVCRKNVVDKFEPNATNCKEISLCWGDLNWVGNDFLTTVVSLIKKILINSSIHFN